jgi:hypothetical protein
MSLPAELRQMIYKRVFSDLTYEMFESQYCWETTERNQRHAFALLRISRQVRAETSMLPYKLATLSFARYSTEFFLNDCPAEKIAAVRNIQFTIGFVHQSGGTYKLPKNYAEMWLRFWVP